MSDDLFAMVIALSALAIVTVIMVLGFVYGFAYKRGQVHALSGIKIIYSLQTRKDGSRYWKHSGGINLIRPSSSTDYPQRKLFERTITTYEENNERNYYRRCF